MDTKDSIKNQLEITEIIGEVVALKSAGGGRLKGLCPFHSEKTPSFTVTPTEGRYYCYGCQAKGDIFDFVMTTQHLDFRAALELLAGRAGVQLPDTRPAARSAAPPKPAKKPLAEMWIDDLVTAAHDALKRQGTALAVRAAAYFDQRGLAHLVDDLRLGVVDDTVDVGQPKRLTGRAVIPTLEGGKAVWFKSRYVGPLSDDEAKKKGIAKYDGPSGSVPAPFNPVALTHAAVKGLPLLLVEGEIDAASVLAVYDNEYPVLGLPGGILPSGWAERIAESGVPVYLLMDPDEAGARHTERVSSVLSGLGARCHIVTPPGPDDLNALLTKHGPEGLRRVIDDLLETTTLASTSDVLYVCDAWLGELDARANRPHAAYSTGLEPLDALLGGGYSEGLHLIGGITGGGKTSFALHVALHNALAGRPVVYASYEQSRLELWARIASAVTGVPYSAIKRGTYDDGSTTVLTSSVLKSSEAWGRLEQASKYLKIVEGGDALSRQVSTYTVDALGVAAQDIADLHGAPPLLIVDYLQRMPVSPELRIKDVRERVSHVAGLLQVNLARTIGCPVIALSSIGRAAYRLQEADLEGRLAAFKEAGELEYTAYTSLLLYGLSDDLQDSLGLRPGMIDTFRPMTMDLVKNREGEIGQLGVRWHVAGGSWAGAVSGKGKR